jgi:hypothetical protein
LSGAEVTAAILRVDGDAGVLADSGELQVKLREEVTALVERLLARR